MQDGQNLFDNATAFAGEWQVDETLNRLFANGDYSAIVVGIENGGWRRVDEYSPWYNAQLEAGGEGAEFTNFIAKTLKPYIDATYRTLSGREYTGIMGSSMGGLISHYAAIQNQGIFGKVGALSPSFWFSENAFTHTSTTGKKGETKYYMLAGDKEGTDMVNGINRMYSTLLAAGFSDKEITKNIVAGGRHNEQFWAQEFEAAYKWLFGNLGLTSTQTIANQAIKLVPNPAFSQIIIENLGEIQGAEIYFTSLDGKVVKRFLLQPNTPLNIDNLSEGTHMVNIIIQNRVIFSDKLIVHRN
jgi:predicted alpha/beta superfamily hydrolase